MDLYRMFNAGNELLYVGISYDAFRRFAEHRATKSWINEVRRFERAPLGDIERKEALAIERDVILREKPKYNVVHNMLSGAMQESDGVTQSRSRPTAVNTLTLMPEWQPLASALSNFVNKADDEYLDYRSLRHMLDYTVRVLQLADATCEGCYQGDSWNLLTDCLWPHRISVRPDGGLNAYYLCPKHGPYQCGWGTMMLNAPLLPGREAA